MTSSSSYNPPCAACKFLRRKCMPGCIFLPHFPPEEPHKFANVHKIFGASNVAKLLNELLPHQRDDAVNSLAYEAEARVRDPIYGCVGAITILQRQVERLQQELDAAADLIHFACNEMSVQPTEPSMHMVAAQRPVGVCGCCGGAGGRYYQASNLAMPYPEPWNDHIYNANGGGMNGNN